MKKNKYKLFINDLIKNNKKLLAHDEKVLKIINLIHKKIANKGKVFIAGNGGSAAHAQHMAAEFLVRLNPKINRKPIPAIALALTLLLLPHVAMIIVLAKFFLVI